MEKESSWRSFYMGAAHVYEGEHATGRPMNSQKWLEMVSDWRTIFEYWWDEEGRHLD